MEDKTRERLKMEGVTSPPLGRTEKTDAAQSMETGRSYRPFFIVAFIAVLVAVWFINNKPAEKPRKPGPVPVVLGVVESRTIPLEIRTIGNVMPISSVTIKSRIEGHLMHVNFKEGDFVAKGARLFDIDPRPLQSGVSEVKANVLKQVAVIKQAEAAVAKDKAQLAQAVAAKARDAAQQRMAAKEIRRYDMLAKQGAVSQEQADQTRSNSEAMDATIRSDEAAIETSKANIAADEANLQNAHAQLAAATAQLQNAKLQLGYTSILAPFAGRTGSLQAFEGNLVKPDDNTLVTLNQMSPIYVAFAVPEQVLDEIQRYQKNGSLEVLAYNPGHEAQAVSGQLTFSENTVDAATGTIKLKATFANADGSLWPGEFVDVVLKLAQQPNAIVVPAQAVQAGQQGPFVYVVGADKTVQPVNVKVDRTVNGLSVIGSGLQVGQQIVLDGQMQLSPGGKVMAKSESTNTTPAK